MPEEPESASELWAEYKKPFTEFDDLTLARWLAQTLGQFEGRFWRMSHPLVGAYRIAAELAHERAIWHQRLATAPPAFPLSECCRTPLLPLFTRDVVNSGLICLHCGETAVEFGDLSDALRNTVEDWAEDYSLIHAVAHYDEGQMRSSGNYEEVFEKAAGQAEEALRKAALEILPQFLEYFPTLLWEDQDDCLEVEPRDIVTWK
jgi:hypothetical protein